MTNSSRPSSNTGRKFWEINYLNNLQISQKLLIGFGILVLITFIAVAISYFGSSQAAKRIETTESVRAPAVLVSSQAQANLLRMLSDVRGYLALGNPLYQDGYIQNKEAFEANMTQLNNLATSLDTDDRQRLRELQGTYAEWVELPDKLFALRDDQLEREPAYLTLATDVSELAGTILIDMNSLIESQSNSEPTEGNLLLLRDMAQFQSTLSSMFSALRGYVTTRNRVFRLEYEANLTANEFAWERLLSKASQLNENQQDKLNDIKFNRQRFLALHPQMFEVLESEEWRTDLYLFTTETLPRASLMQNLLSSIANDQQVDLQVDLTQGRQDLGTANQRILISGIVALLIGIGLAMVFRDNIAGPVRRLTYVAEKIRAGDLEAMAQVESRDEIGTLATTFNKMTTQLRNTLFQVQTEKKRADDLLEVVIPIGVELSSEKDFNRLLEKMLVEAKDFCHAQGGTLYLRTDKDELEAVIIRNHSLNIFMGGTSGNAVTMPNILLKDLVTGEPNLESITAYTVNKKESVNVPNRYADERFQSTESKIFNVDTDYRPISYLSIPLQNNQGEVIGAMQLVNATDKDTKAIIPFDANIQQMMESFSTLAMAALEAYKREQSLRQEIKQLRIQIDESKRQQAVESIVEAEGFNELQAKAASMRRRRGRRNPSNTEDE